MGFYILVITIYWRNQLYWFSTYFIEIAFIIFLYKLYRKPHFGQKHGSLRQFENMVRMALVHSFLLTMCSLSVSFFMTSWLYDKYISDTEIKVG